MPVSVPRGPRPEEDEGLRAVVGALEQYQHQHPGSGLEAYRHGQFLIRIRVINPAFRGMTKSERHKAVWPYLNDLPEEVVSDVSTLILLTPEELKSSFASFEFDDPIPSRL
jgi:hypothetical protein